MPWITINPLNHSPTNPSLPNQTLTTRSTPQSYPPNSPRQAPNSSSHVHSPVLACQPATPWWNRPWCQAPAVASPYLPPTTYPTFLHPTRWAPTPMAGATPSPGPWPYPPEWRNRAPMPASWQLLGLETAHQPGNKGVGVSSWRQHAAACKMVRADVAWHVDNDVAMTVWQYENSLWSALVGSARSVDTGHYGVDHVAASGMSTAPKLRTPQWALLAATWFTFK